MTQMTPVPLPFSSSQDASSGKRGLRRGRYFKNAALASMPSRGIFYAPSLRCTIVDFMRVMKTLDPDAQASLFPDPYWFFSKNYHVTRVGVKEVGNSESYPPPVRMGVEYQSDFFTEVLILPVPMDISENLLSQIEMPVYDTSNEEAPPFGDFQGETN